MSNQSSNMPTLLNISSLITNFVLYSIKKHPQILFHIENNIPSVPVRCICSKSSINRVYCCMYGMGASEHKAWKGKVISTNQHAASLNNGIGKPPCGLVHFEWRGVVLVTLNMTACDSWFCTLFLQRTYTYQDSGYFAF